tara:strand:- start:241 stop:852 length:612 start_codon:yes stop_codon:yes gene_type:complete
MGSPVITGEHKRLDALAHQYGVGVSTPSYSSRIMYFYNSVSNGRRIEGRINAVGGGVSNMAELQRKELEQSPAYIAEQKEIARLAEVARLAEIARLELIVRNDAIALALFTKLDNQRIADENAEIARLAAVKEAQRVAAVNAENLRLKLQKERLELERVTEVNRLQGIEDKETQRVTKSIPLLTTILPIGLIGLFLYSRTARK